MGPISNPFHLLLTVLVQNFFVSLKNPVDRAHGHRDAGQGWDWRVAGNRMQKLSDLNGLSLPFFRSPLKNNFKLAIV
jgi:hypothetical protein